MQKPDQFRSFFYPLPVDRDSLGFIFPQMHVDAIINTALHDHTPYMCFLHAETDHIPVAHTAVRFSGGYHKERFQYISLSLCVFTVEYIGSLRKIHVKRHNISEIRQFQTADIHKNSVDVNEPSGTVLSDSFF